MPIPSRLRLTAVALAHQGWLPTQPAVPRFRLSRVNYRRNPYNLCDEVRCPLQILGNRCSIHPSYGGSWIPATYSTGGCALTREFNVRG